MAKLNKPNKRPSMKDVADLAGVSRTTVSFVLNKKPDSNIPQETQDRVWDAVKTLGYRPNAIAQGLRSQRTNTIGFISDHVMTTPYAGQMLLGAQDHAWQQKMLLLSVSTGGDQGIKEASIEMLIDRKVDGIIYAAMYHRQVEPLKNTQSVPTILLDCFVEDQSIPAIIPDEELGGYEATRTLIDQGHRRIGHISDSDPVPAQVGRLLGYKRALAEENIPFDPNLVKYGVSYQIGGYKATKALMALDNRPTALFCYNDRMAMGAYDALRELNLTIPNDVAIVGFDNHEIIAAHLLPALTTVQLPHYEMGQAAVQTLLQLINRKLSNRPQDDIPIEQKIRCKPVLRHSV